MTLRERCPVDWVGREDAVDERNREGRVLPGVHAALVYDKTGQHVAVEAMKLLNFLVWEIPRCRVV